MKKVTFSSTGGGGCEIGSVRAMLLMGVAYIFSYYYSDTCRSTATFN